MDDRVSSVRAAPVDAPHDTALSELGSEVVSELDRAREASGAAARVRAKIATNIPPRLRAPVKRRVRPAAVVTSLALAASIVLAIGFGVARRGQTAAARMPEPAPPISFTVAGSTGPAKSFIAAATETPVQFSDGSELRLAPAARVRVTETASNGARVLVETGSMHVSVVHREQTRWAIEAGPYEVRVTGTKFVVAWDPAKNGLVVRMEEGSVVVKGCGDEEQRLGAGESLVVSCKDGESSESNKSIESSESEKVQDEEAVPDEPAAAPAAPAAKPKPADPTRAIVAHARAGENAEAIAAAEEHGYDATLGVLSGPELLLIANAARYSGKFDHANAALETARRRFPDTDAAAQAAFELGRIAMDVRRQLGPAGDHFEVYLRERPNGGFAREAMGRAIEARHGAGDDDRAERLAVRYLASWPDGPHAALARKLTGEKGSR
ncbi:MAG: FecR domain-containing protein [Labilithrix sp.]|nr:FecR domain-containing protein [Labilithrix sp.]MCW5810779.1 FecR domain-containing protein [Labilithrix sp.]